MTEEFRPFKVTVIMKYGKRETFTIDHPDKMRRFLCEVGTPGKLTFGKVAPKDNSENMGFLHIGTYTLVDKDLLSQIVIHFPTEGESDFIPVEVVWDLVSGHHESFWITSKEEFDDITKSFNETYSTFVYQRKFDEDPAHPRLEKIIVYGPKSPPEISPERRQKFED